MLTLPPALAHLATYRQFLLYKVVHVPGEAKPRKLPLHPETLRAVDAHDPTAWTDAATACKRATLLGAPYGVAFSFQPGNGLFFVDIDGALQADGTWSPLAVQLCQRFPGAAVEVSQSGKGLHIIGRGTAPPHACKNVPLGIECYTEYRFVALTGIGAVGDAGTDHTAALATLVAEYFPPRAGDGLPDGQWTKEPRADWRGPADDAELIRRAMKSTSVAAQFGANRATFPDLFGRNTDVLCAVWPDPLKGYDASSADAALAAHLAFWTGADCERMERLMRQSALVREKWERHDYLPRTILGAAARQKDVLKDRPATPPPPAIGRETFAISDVADLLKSPVLPVQYVVNGWMPEGLVLLVASPKVGKSTLILQIAVSLAAGGEFWGYKQKRAGILMIDLETNERRLRRKLESAGLTSVPADSMLYATSWERGAAGVAAIAATLKAQPHIKLVVIDTLQRFREAGSGRQNAYAADYEALAPLQQLCRDTPGLAIVCVHHKRKAAVDDPIDSINGSAAIAGAADSIWIMSRKGPDFYLTIQARDWERDEDEFRIERAGGGWRLADGHRLTESDLQTLGLLRTTPDLTAPSLATSLGIGRQAAFERLKRLEAKGLVHHDGKAWRAAP